MNTVAPTFTIPPLLRREKVLELTGFTSVELDHEIERGLFPPPVKLSPEGDAVGWNGLEVAVLNASKIGSASAEDVRRIVRRLIAARAMFAAPYLGAQGVASEPVSVSRAVN